MYLAIEQFADPSSDILLENLTVCPRILEHIPLKMDEQQEHTPMHFAAERACHKPFQILLIWLKNLDKMKLIRKILETPNKNGMTVLKIAYEKKCYETLKVILEFLNGYLPDFMLG